ncbi:hypothetical protein HanIR_Chr14g0714681 [Helianthus annuus]|nr:hypothetical protein HanIR_Chr14g0714681 [Helianthus annuus]
MKWPRPIVNSSTVPPDFSSNSYPLSPFIKYMSKLSKTTTMALSCSGLTFKLHVLEWSVIDLISNFMIVEGSDMKPADLNGAGKFRTKIHSKMV